ncbi:XrtA/PEP-CTERM system TPR-repeat protein PrsT [Acidihalobacter ferrooxydans]|uniref:Uncharacterized protein n=1 Tax=Acidihalobacter ferrooxydans TaxID=1765967 RepID=A0A1P8UGL4_9GAMM|nr:XrtA/PEP-CTERM system TPR-repeat protein PrsT [Acidihalobacter ferrooxydans]APZ42976.1 hypothetical protein BW247_07610 [Acidihalobacter ferrooxydans]
MRRRTRRLTALISTTLLTTVLLTACSGHSPVSQLQKARQNIADGKQKTALIILRNLVKDNPDNEQARVLLGSLLYKLGYSATAAAQLQQAETHGALPLDAQFDLAHALIQTGHLEEAEKTAASIKPVTSKDTARKLALLGMIQLDKKANKKAAKLFSEALAKDPHSVQAMIGEGIVALTEGDIHLATTKADNALLLAPKNGAAWMLKGDAALSELHVQDATNAFKKAIANGPPALSPYQVFVVRGRLAQAELTLGQRKQALKNIEIMLKQSPKAPFPNYLRGLIAYQDKDYQTATNHLQLALNADPYNVRALTLLGASEADQGQNVLAITHLTGALAQDPQNVFARRMLAQVQLKTGATTQAIDTILQGTTAGAGSTAVLSLFASPGSAIKTLSAMPSNAGASVHANTIKLALAQAMILDAKQQQALSLLSQIKGGNAHLNALRLQAVAYLQDKKPTEAIKIAQQIAQRGHADRSAQELALAATIYQAAGAQTQADTLLRQAYTLAPDNTTIGNALGALSLRKGQLDQATRYYQNTVKHDPGNLDALTSLARIAALQGHSAEALKWLHTAHDKNPKAVRPLLALAQYKLAQHQTGQALGYMQQAVALAPANPAVLTLLAKTQLANGQKQAALQTFQSAADLAPNDPRYALSLAAMQAIVLKQTVAAEKTLKGILSKHPDYLPAVRALALTQWKNGQHQQAFTTAKSYNHNKTAQDVAGRNLLLGDLYMLDKKYPEALKHYRTAYAQSPTRDALVRIYSAQSEGHLGDPAQTLIGWLAHHPDDASIRAALGLYYLQNGRLKKAATEYEATLKLAPDSPIVLNNLAWVVSQDNPQHALPYAEKAHRLAPNSSAIADTLGWILLRDGKAEAALPLLKQAAQSPHASASIHYHYAVALEKTGHSQLALAELQKALATKTPFSGRTQADQLLQKLKSR